jgi:selenocysteine-specific elongation factor
VLRRLGVPTDPLPDKARLAGDWLVSGSQWRAWQEDLVAAVTARDEGLSPAAAARAVGVPEPDLVTSLVSPPLRVVAGRIVLDTGLPDRLRDALDVLRAELTGHQFDSPDAERLAALGIDRAALAQLARTRDLLVLGEGIALLPGADELAAKILSGLDQPFTTSEARQAFETSRRVALALLAHLDRTGRTVRLPDDRRRVRGMRRSPLPTRRWSNYFTRGYTALPYVLPLLLRSSCHLPVTPTALA